MSPEMSREGFSSPEEKEAESRQAQVDRAFELAVLSRFSEKFFDEDRDSDVFDAAEALLSEPINQHFGEPYKLDRQGDRFTLAQRLRANTTWDFDPLASLAIKWDKDVDLPSGQVTIDYGVYAKAKESDGWDEWRYTEPRLEDQHLQFTASPEAVERVYERLEREFAEKVRKYEADAAKYEKAAAWVAANKGKRFGPGDPAPEALADVVPEGMTWEVDFDTTLRNEGALNVLVRDKESLEVLDIYDIPKPVPPERGYAPRGSEDEK